MYLDKLFPFLKDGDFIRSKREMINTRDIYCPLDADLSVVNIDLKNNKKFFKLIRVMPCNVLVVNESDEVALKLKNGIYGNPIKAIISEIDYSPIASRVEVETVDDIMSATLNLGGSY